MSRREKLLTCTSAFIRDMSGLSYHHLNGEAGHSQQLTYLLSVVRIHEDDRLDSPGDQFGRGDDGMPRACHVVALLIGIRVDHTGDPLLAGINQVN